MIDANELMIGNWVEIDGKFKQVLSVTDLYFDDKDGSAKPYINVNGNSVGFIKRYLHSVDPIPLTPELLEKCGFTYYDNNSWQLDIDFGISFWGRGDTVNIYSESTEVGTDIKYLHQLQNCHYALTSKHLTIQL